MQSCAGVSWLSFIIVNLALWDDDVRTVLASEFVALVFLNFGTGEVPWKVTPVRIIFLVLLVLLDKVCQHYRLHLFYTFSPVEASSASFTSFSSQETLDDFLLHVRTIVRKKLIYIVSKRMIRLVKNSVGQFNAFLSRCAPFKCAKFKSFPL